MLVLLGIVMCGRVLPVGHTPVVLVLGDQNDSLQIFLNRLREQGGSIDPWLFERLLRCALLGKKVTPGIYRITSDDHYWQLWKRIYVGAADYQAITLVEGWTFKQALKAIARNPHLKHTIGDDQDQSAVMSQLGYTAEAPEGRFAPDTYYFAPGSSDVALLRRAYQQLLVWLQQEWQQRNTDQYQCPYQALIVASLLEREVRRPEELELVAGVILTRLAKGMRLQIDASTIYGLGEAYDGKLTRQQLRTDDSAYNTYRHHGLPPTPICLPGRQAIRAALHPKFGYLYYVAKKDGSHHFSKELAEHNRAVRIHIYGDPSGGQR